MRSSRSFRIYEAFNHAVLDCTRQIKLDADYNAPALAAARESFIDALDSDTGILCDELSACIEAYKLGWHTTEQLLGCNISRPRTFFTRREKSWKALLKEWDDAGCW